MPIATTYELKEVVKSNQTSRLFFVTPSSNSIIKNVNYTGINVSFCDNVRIYIKVRNYN